MKQRDEKAALRKQIQNEKKANVKPIDNLSDVANYYYVSNGKFNKDEFNQQMNDYKKYLSIKNKDDLGTFRQDIDSTDHKNEDINDLLYSNNSIPGQPNKQGFMDPYIGINIPEYESFEDKENEAKEIEKECSEDPNRDMYIKKGESIESNNTNAGYKYDRNHMKRIMKI